MNATMTSVGEMTADELAAQVREDGAPAEQIEGALKELNRRAKDGEQDAVDVLEQITAAKLEAEEALDAGGDIEKGDVPAEVPTSPEVVDGDAPPSYADELAAAREAEGLNAESALPEAADEKNNAVDLSGGIELQLPGLEGPTKISFAGIGGKKPDESFLRIVGGAFAIPTQFEKGQDLCIEIKGRVTGIAFDDTVDAKTAQATTSKRTHKARVIGAVLVDKGVAAKLEELQDAARAFLESASSEDQARLQALVAAVE